MKAEDFERLNDKLGDEFEVTRHWDTMNVVVVKKKEPWDGVEFGEVTEDGTHVKKGQIFKLLELSKGLFWSTFNYYKVGEVGKDGVIWISQEILKPSTEATYIEQLKKEAFESFGDIKEGDRFDRTGVTDGVDEIGICCENKSYKPVFSYYKDDDSLEFGGIIIYEGGKWATRVKDKVRVELLKINSEKYNSNTTKHSLKFLVSEEIVLSEEAGKFLAKQLEEYLNK